MIELKELVRRLRNDSVDKHRCFGCGYEHSCGTRGCKIMREAADVLESQQKRISELESRWIPVTERLPESGERVIVCRGDKVEQGVFRGVNGWWKVYGTNTKKVTHWMPMPEPPKEDAK